MPRSEDIHVGQRIRQRRHVLAMTQQEVAKEIGTKFQQLQKYETGANRVSASRLCDLASVLKVAPSYFFEGLDCPAATDDLRSKAEADLLAYFRQSPADAQVAILGIAEATAQASAQS